MNCVSPAPWAMYDTQNAVSKQFWTKKLDLHNSSITLNVLYSCQVAQVTNNKEFWLSQIRSVAQSCLTLCNPMNRSTPGLPVHHQLPEFTQTHVHRVSYAIQASHPLSSPSPLAPNPSQHQSLFQWVNSSHEVAKVLELEMGKRICENFQKR